ncbi:MAG: DUF1573 domain-containing protein [Bacteroidota bacterium]|nr:DUF1573 domain-containing protein [Bacteroidota bacterium]
MKHFLILSIIIIFAFGCNNQDSSQKINENDTTLIEFEENIFDFGSLTQGEQIKHTYKFKNTGNKPLIIIEAHSTCGCTVADYSDKPINPQSEGYVKVTFNSSGKRGHQSKVITIISNTKPEENLLLITGNVIVPDKQDFNN